MGKEYTVKYKESIIDIISCLAALPIEYDKLYSLLYFHRLIRFNTDVSIPNIDILQTLTTTNIIIKNGNKNKFSINSVCKNIIPIELIEYAENNNMAIDVVLRDVKIKKIRENIERKEIKPKKKFRFKFPWN